MSTLKLSTIQRTFSTHFEILKHFEELSFTLENLQHLEEVSSTPPTHLEKLQAPCTPPLGNELPLTLQTKNPSLKKDSLLFFMQYKLKTFHYFLFQHNVSSLARCGPITYWKQLENKQEMKASRFMNGTIVLTNKKITKVVCFKCYNHKTMTCNN
jgi:hypothetical protein